MGDRVYDAVGRCLSYGTLRIPSNHRDSLLKRVCSSRANTNPDRRHRSLAAMDCAMCLAAKLDQRRVREGADAASWTERMVLVPCFGGRSLREIGRTLVRLDSHTHAGRLEFQC